MQVVTQYYDTVCNLVSRTVARCILIYYKIATVSTLRTPMAFLRDTQMSQLWAVALASVHAESNRESNTVLTNCRAHEWNVTPLRVPILFNIVSHGRLASEVSDLFRTNSCTKPFVVSKSHCFSRFQARRVLQEIIPQWCQCKEDWLTH
jgi:hypothetical protein